MRWIAFLFCSSFLSPAWADEASKLADHFNLYIIKEELRSPLDRAVVKGNTGDLYYWEYIGTSTSNELLCKAFQYLLLGRSSYGRGAKEAFSKFSSLQKINLIFYDYQFSTKRGSKIGEILPDQKMFEYLKIGIDRDSFSRKGFDRKQFQKNAASEKCVEVGKTFVDTVMIREEFLKDKK